MKRIGGVIPFSLDGFNFLQQNLPGPDEQAVNAPPNLQREVRRFHAVFHGQFRQIAGRAGALDFLVAANAGLSAVGADKLALATEVAWRQDKLDQLAHRNRVHWF